MKTVSFRGGCITGPNHSGAKLHGFLSYLVKSCVSKKKYTIIGYKGKQVRDNLHSEDLVNCFWEFYKKPKKGEVYNIGGGRYSNCSVIEALNLIEKITKKRIEGMPLAYLTKERLFFNERFYVDKNVLIPRHETEELIDYFFSLIEKENLKRQQKKEFI